MNPYTTEQEQFWAGNFGDEYVSRSQSHQLISSNTALFTQILQRTKGIQSVIEFGSNVGNNLHVIRTLLPYSDLSAIEINSTAVEYLKKIDRLSVYHQSILEFTTDKVRDFVFIKGVLIHINPDELNTVYKKLYETSSRYICLIEYYNPTPVEINYRGHSEKLFKRDFAGEMMDLYPDLELIGYGFTYHRDPTFPLDDSTWFLMEKKTVNG